LGGIVLVGGIAVQRAGARQPGIAQRRLVHDMQMRIDDHVSLPLKRLHAGMRRDFIQIKRRSSDRNHAATSKPATWDSWLPASCSRRIAVDISGAPGWLIRVM